MKKLLIVVLVMLSFAGYSQQQLWGPGTKNLKTNLLSLMNDADTIGRFSSVGIRFNKPVRFTGLGSASSDTSNIKPLGINSSGDIVPLASHFGSGGALPTQTGNAGKVLTTNGTSASWGNPYFPWDFASRDSATTSNAVATTLATITIDDNTRGIIEVRLEGINATAGLTGIKRVRWKKISGTLTLGTVEDEMAIERDGGLTTATFTISTSSNNIIIQVTGEASTTLDWKATYFMTQKFAAL